MRTNFMDEPYGQDAHFDGDAAWTPASPATPPLGRSTRHANGAALANDLTQALDAARRTEAARSVAGISIARSFADRGGSVHSTNPLEGREASPTELLGQRIAETATVAAARHRMRTTLSGIAAGELA